MTTPTPETITIPRAGMLATVRNRRGVVAAVEPFDGETGRLHLVHLEYKDDHAPSEERILWEIEPSRHLDEPNALPNPAHSGGAMPAEDFDALVRAARWTALSPYLDPAGGEGPPPREPVASPFHGGVCVESYQLVPLLKALRMPRVSLLIADDVGLGKTVEAGLILTELLLRRRIQRVLVLTPASLRRQWQEELWEKFSLRFERRPAMTGKPSSVQPPPQPLSARGSGTSPTMCPTKSAASNVRSRPWDSFWTTPQ